MTLRLTDTSPKIWGENLPFWFVVLARVASLLLMLSGLFYWVDILGVFGESGLERGDWQEAALRVILSCAFLIAAIGVWQLTFWGVVMWVLSAITQTLAIMLTENFAPLGQLITFAHMLGLIGLISVTGWVYYQATRQTE